MKIILSLTMTLCICAIGLSQDFKYGKVSKAELQEKVHPLDSSANAAVLYRNEAISFVYTESDGFMQEREVHERIKIYTKEGFDWATKKIYIYEGGGGKTEKLRDLKGVTYNMINGKVSKDKLKKDGIFEEDYNDFTEINTITMPNIKESCVIEYTYKIISPFLEIDDVVFQYDIPINRLDFRVATPQYYSYNTQFNTKASFSPSLKRSTMKKEVVVRGTKDYIGKGLNGASQSTSGGTLKYDENVLKAEEVNIPALKTEAYAGNMNNYRSKMSMELSASLNQYGGIERSFATNWEKVSKYIYDNPNFGGQISRVGFFKDDIASMVSGVDDDFQKSFVLQNYVKSKVKWNGLYGFRALKGTRTAYKEGEGNVADINLLLIAMLKSQGINANPVLVSTRNHGIPLFPTQKGFNYVICIVQSGDNYILLDASEPYSMVNVLPERTLNWKGRVVLDNGSSGWVSLRPNTKSVESTSLNIKINDDLSVSGKVRKSLTSHLAMRYRSRFAKRNSEDHIKAIENGKGDIEISELNFENKTDITKPVMLSYNYELSDGIDDIGGKLYFSPLLFLTTKESPFKLDERKYPIDFAFPYEDKFLVNIMLPEGYKVEALPKSEAYEFKEGAAKFSYIAKENGNFLQLSISFNLKASLIDPADYAVFKDFFEKIVEKQAEQIVLTKA